MATSGTVGQTRVDVTNLIEHSFRRCGKLASTISGELQQSARENLFFLLSDLANRGLSLFCVKKTVLNVVANSTVYSLPTGTVDLLDAMYRTQTALTGTTTLAAGNSQLALSAADTCRNVAIQLTAAATVTLVIEYSLLGSIWVQAAAFPAATALAAGEWFSQDIDNTVEAQYWRVRDTSGTLPAYTTLTYSNEPYEVSMSKLNRDDYVSLPNKGFTVPSGTKSLQYWFDKQINPRIWIWPASGGDSDQIVVWTQSQIEDVGSLSNGIAVPQRWYESIIYTLACRCALEMPPGELPPGRLEFLEVKAEQHLTQAEDSENDGAPMRLAPNISGYTR
jgi:hypothetical protein